MLMIIKKPSAWLPIVMSSIAIALVLSYVATHGIQEPQADESLAARIFQLLLVLQVPIMAFFALSWLPKQPIRAAQVLFIQILAALSAFFLVFYLEM